MRHSCHYCHNVQMVSLISRYQGSLIGLAVGDALGVPAEFKKVGEFPPITDFSYCEHFDLPPGCWSDDTAMALCLGLSLVEKEGFDAVDQIEKYKKWFLEGYCTSTGRTIGVGQTIMRALLNYQPGGDPYAAVNTRHSEGNGSLMRIAPIALFYRSQPSLASEYSSKSSYITHSASVCAETCKYFTGLMIGVLNGASKEAILQGWYIPTPEYMELEATDEEIKRVALGSYKEAHPPYISASGHVVKSMEAALWAFYTTDSFQEGVLKVVNLGDDADTVGAIYGQIAGAYYGLEAIPEKWVAEVAKREDLLNTAEQILELSHSQ